MRLNLGCGQTPTPGWVNIDNSLSVRLARTPLAPLLRSKRDYIRCIRENDIRPGSAERIPVPDGSLDVLYTSHMLEHLDRREAQEFLGEARRVLKPGGILRIVVPDLKKHVQWYLESADADRFVDGLLLARTKPVGLLAKLRFSFIDGFRDHHWMYDSDSLARLVRDAGFSDPVCLEPGETRIPDPGALDLREREGESLYLECVR